MLCKKRRPQGLWHGIDPPEVVGRWWPHLSGPGSRKKLRKSSRSHSVHDFHHKAACAEIIRTPCTQTICHFCRPKDKVVVSRELLEEINVEKGVVLGHQCYSTSKMVK